MGWHTASVRIGLLRHDRCGDRAFAMPKEQMVAMGSVARAADRLESTGRESLGDYLALTKPRLNSLVVTTTAAGCYFGRRMTGCETR
jgi:hypothetical protein